MHASSNGQDPLRPAVRTLIGLCASGSIDDRTLGDSLRALANERPDGWSLVALAVGGAIRRFHLAQETQLWARVDAAEPRLRPTYELAMQPH